MEITSEEQKAINNLKRLALKWPKTLWLFSASGTLHVMKTGKNGEHVVIPGLYNGGMNPDYSIANINIPNDGGDW